jgi:O-antigen ligase
MNIFGLFFLYLTLFTLPMFTQVNNYLLGAFIGIGIIQILVSPEKRERIKLLGVAWPVLSLFLLALFSCLRGFEVENLKSLERFWSLLLLPVVFISDSENIYKKKRQIFLALLYGTLVAFLLGFGNVIYRMVQNGDSLAMIYSAPYIGFNFTQFIDSHPAYLGLFALVSVVFLLGDRFMPRKDKIPHILLLLLGLVQLAGRTALLLLVAFLVILIVFYVKRFRWQALMLFGGVFLISALFIRYGSPQMTKMIFSIEANSDEYRNVRWEVSYEIFKANPILGVGYTKVREMRSDLYRERGLSFMQGDYNTHNQFLEYLSTNGAIGGFIYVMTTAYLLLASLKYKDLLYVFLFGAFVVSNMTESMFVRIKGIEFFAIFATLFLCELIVKGKYHKAWVW